MHQTTNIASVEITSSMLILRSSGVTYFRAPCSRNASLQIDRIGFKLELETLVLPVKKGVDDFVIRRDCFQVALSLFSKISKNQVNTTSHGSMAVLKVFSRLKMFEYEIHFTLKFPTRPKIRQ